MRLAWQSIKQNAAVLIINIIQRLVRKLKEIAGNDFGRVPQQSVTPLPHVIATGTSSSAAYSGPFRMPGVMVPTMSTGIAMPAAALGYSQSHGGYYSERSRQSKKVYASQALSCVDNTINLIVQFGHEVRAGGKSIKLEIINVRGAN